MPRRVPRRRRKGGLIEDPQRAEVFITSLEKGAVIRHAAQAAGLVERTVLRWIAQGDEAQALADDGERLSDHEEACRRFAQTVHQVRGSVATEAVGILQEVARGGHLLERRTIPRKDGQPPIVEEKYAPPNERAADLLLRRSFSHDFNDASRVELEVTGPAGGPVQVAAAENPTIAALAASLRSELSRDPADDVVEGELVAEPYTPDP